MCDLKICENVALSQTIIIQETDKISDHLWQLKILDLGRGCDSAEEVAANELTKARSWRSDQRKAGPSDQRRTRGEVPRVRCSESLLCQNAVSGAAVTLKRYKV